MSFNFLIQVMVVTTVTIKLSKTELVTYIKIEEKVKKYTDRKLHDFG